MAESLGDHAHLTYGTVVNNRYEILNEVGRGNFSVVYAARDRKDPDVPVALKFVKKEYTTDAKFEHDILRAITKADPERKERVLCLVEHFIWNRHPCFVLEQKGCALKSRRFGVPSGHVPMSELRELTRQMLEGLRFLHFGMKLVHTDLKPENILLDRASPPASGIGSGWCIVDFGSASFYRMDRLDSDLISTRPYRAPEVILGNGWYWPADTWSMGCILYEVYTGRKLFDINDDYVHLAHMAAKLGRFPTLFTQHSRQSRRFFNADGRINRPLRFPSTPPKTVAEDLAAEPLFADLICQMLAFEPQRRIRADDALRHPFFDANAAPKRLSQPMLPDRVPPPPFRALAPNALSLSSASAARPEVPCDRPPPCCSRAPAPGTPTSPASSVSGGMTSTSRTSSGGFSIAKRAKCDPFTLPPAGKSSGMQYTTRLW